MLNKVILIGRLGKDPIVRYMPDGEAVCNFSVATSESWNDRNGQRQERTEWHNITMYRRLAEIAGQYLEKGSQVYLEGKIQSRKYQDKNGVERTAYDIIANEMKMLGGGNSEQQAAIESLRSNDSDDLSPNQRREILKPLLKLIQYCEAYDAVVPEKTIDKVGLYCASVQIALYTASLYERPKRYIQALFDIINGKSIRAVAKDIGEKENVLREEVLNAAWHFYRVAECNNTIEPANTIPELRHDDYKTLGSFDRLSDFVRVAMAKILIPFEENTGISLINYNQFRKDLIRAEII